MDPKHRLELQPRLQAIADWVRPGARIVDVGTDHGYLPVFLLQNGTVGYAIASDINAAPLDHARRSAAEYGQEMDFRLCNGLEAVGPDEVDTVVIAGMGGENIAAILLQAPWTKEGHTLLLQPMSRPDYLRRFLGDHGYRITRERLVRDKGLLYPIVEAEGGYMAPLSPGQLCGGVGLKRDPLEGEYLDGWIKKLSRAAAGLRQGRDTGEQADEMDAVVVELRQMKGEWEHANCTAD